MACSLDDVIKEIFNNGGIPIPALQSPSKYFHCEYAATRNAYQDLKKLYQDEIKKLVQLWEECEEPERNVRVHYFISQVDQDKIDHYILAIAMFSPPAVYKSLCMILAHTIPTKTWVYQEGQKIMHFVLRISRIYYEYKITAVFKQEHLKRLVGLVFSIITGVTNPQLGYVNYSKESANILASIIPELPEIGTRYPWKVWIPIVVQFWLDNHQNFYYGFSKHFLSYLFNFLIEQKNLIAKKIKKTPAEVEAMLNFYFDTGRFELPPPKPKTRPNLLI